MKSIFKIFQAFCVVTSAVFFTSWLTLVCAQTPAIDASLHETVLMIPKKGLFTIELETTLFKPEGVGPFPVAVINHGKSAGNSYFQPRYRPLSAVRYFLQRGYAVVVPMRQGFSKSGGSFITGGCNVESNGRAHAEDVKAALDYAVGQTWADKDRIVVVGQSHGGWTTLAFGAQNYPGVKALINFAGGLRNESCSSWERGLAKGAAEYAKETRVPSLWFYGSNDSFFNTDTSSAMFKEYTSAGGNARMVAFGNFGIDSHSLFGSSNGAPIWQPEVTAFLLSLGLPNEIQAVNMKFGKDAVTPLPLPLPLPLPSK